MTRQSDSGGVASSAAPDCFGDRRRIHAPVSRSVSPEVMALLTVCEFRLSPPTSNSPQTTNCAKGNNMQKRHQRKYAP